MSRERVPRCHECGKQKGEVNHWFTLATFPGGEFLASHFISNDDAEGTFDVCGQECATKAFQRWMATGDIKKPVSRDQSHLFTSVDDFTREVLGGGSNE